MTSSPRQRLLAGLIDLALLSGWAVLMGLVVLVAVLAGVPRGFGPFDYTVLSLVLIVLPATAALTAMEAGRYEATPGKLRVGLRVRVAQTGDRIGYARSFGRNLLKLGLVWVLAELAAVAVVTSPTPDAVVGALLAMVVPAAYLVSLFAGGGRTLYDWLTGTTVITTAAGRRFAADDPVPDEPASPGKPDDVDGVARS